MHVRELAFCNLANAARRSYRVDDVCSRHVRRSVADLRSRTSCRVIRAFSQRREKNRRRNGRRSTPEQKFSDDIGHEINRRAYLGDVALPKESAELIQLQK
jgi:hypothetical protein